jgi:hypothetical protein
VKKYRSGLDGRPARLESEFNEANPIERPAAPETDAPKRKVKASPGRTARLTQRIQEIICEVIAKGNYQRVAAQAAGISEETLQKWRQRGRRGIEPYATLERAIEQTDRDCESALVAKVIAATSADWRAAALMLERKYPERWSRWRERAAFESPSGDGVSFQINITFGGGDDIHATSAGSPHPRSMSRHDATKTPTRPELKAAKGRTGCFPRDGARL